MLGTNLLKVKIIVGEKIIQQARALQQIAKQNSN